MHCHRGLWSSVGGDCSRLCAKSSLIACRQQLDGMCEGPFRLCQNQVNAYKVYAMEFYVLDFVQKVCGQSLD